MITAGEKTTLGVKNKQSFLVAELHQSPGIPLNRSKRRRPRRNNTKRRAHRRQQGRQRKSVE